MACGLHSHSLGVLPLRGLLAAQNMQLEVARKAFIRTRDVRYVELTNRVEAGRKQGTPDTILLAEVMAYQVPQRAMAGLSVCPDC
jgi:hypothetical protein